MTNDRDEQPPAERRSPVGAPVVRGNPKLTGSHADRAKQFDPDDEESLALAAEAVREFAGDTGGADSAYILEGAAACAALVRGEGSYKAAAKRAGGEATVSFIRKWARVHDLQRSIRRHVAMGEIAPTAAKHIARVAGEERFLLAWAVLDSDLTVRQVRAIASAINDGTPAEQALSAHGISPGELSVGIPVRTYRDLRRRASLDDVEPDVVITKALEAYLEDERSLPRQ